MKVLAIRGRNLASLPEFELRFDSGPLARAGTFAITGPTGAGKSTIFDALCLALFGATPRYDGRGHLFGEAGVDDKDKVTSTDPRGILRRGTGEGWAEAEFTAMDGGAFRARWTVARARKKPTGKLQPAIHAVVEVGSEQVVASGLSGVKDWVSEHIGLTLEQFTRSVLLPQGEFARFLKAKAEERSALLEKVTDSVVYRRIGKLAFERWRTADGNHAALLAKQGAIELWTAEMRAEREAAKLAGLADAKKAKEELAEAQVQVAWFARRGAIERALNEAVDALSGAESAWEISASRRETLARIERAEPLRVSVEAAGAGAARLGTARVDVERAERARTDAELAVASTKPALEAAETALRDASAALTNARPRLTEARRLDTTITTLDGHVNDAQAAATALRGQHAAEADQLAKLEAHQATLNELERTTSAWITEHAHLTSLAEQGSLVEKLLADFAEAHAAAAALAAARPALVNSAAIAADGEQRAAAIALTTTEALSVTSSIRAEAEAAAVKAPISAVNAARATLEAQRARLDQLGTLVRNATRAVEDAALADGEAAVASEQAAAHEVCVHQHHTRAVETKVRLDEAARLRHHASLTADLEVHRAALVEGEPCPLCGAPDHPFATKPPVVDALLAGLQTRVGELDKELRALDAAGAKETALAKVAVRLSDEAQKRADRHRQTQQGLVAQWQALGCADAPSADVLRPQFDAYESELSALRRKEAAATEAAGVETEAREAERRALEAAGAAERAARQATGAAEQARAAVVGNEQSTLRNTEAADAAIRGLAPHFAAWPGWLVSLRTDPPAFRERCLREARRFREKTLALAEAVRALGLGGVEVQGLAERVKDTGERAEAAAADLLGRQTQLAAARAERLPLFGGAPADQEERRLTERETATRTAAARAAELAQQASELTARASATLEAATTAARTAASESVRFNSARDSALLAAGFTLVEAEQCLSTPAEAVQAERATIDGHRRKRDDALVTHDGKAAELRTHDALPHADSTVEDAEQAVRTAQAEADEATKSVGALDEALRRDDEAQKRFGAFAGELAELKSVLDRWARMKHLIGDGDGAKFSKFAQSITLEVLVAHANMQLRELAPRYLLQRVPGLELELQVIDRENADDVRSLASLSGGETFLASLALALGLASIATKNLKIGSLFIDEGFGTLDAETLKVAIQLLDGLRASGRQVGIISHVEGLANQLGAWVAVEKVTATRSIVRVGVGQQSADAD